MSRLLQADHRTRLELLAEIAKLTNRVRELERDQAANVTSIDGQQRGSALGQGFYETPGAS
jgi:hypothetical protein